MPLPSRNPVAVALYVNAALLLAILAVLMSRPAFPQVLPLAQGQTQSSPAIAGGGGVYVMPAQFHGETWGCFLLDVDAQTLCTYEYDQSAKQLKLISARDFRYDRLLRDFATTPAPWEVEQMVEQEKQTPHANNGTDQTH